MSECPCLSISVHLFHSLHGQNVSPQVDDILISIHHHNGIDGLSKSGPLLLNVIAPGLLSLDAFLDDCCNTVCNKQITLDTRY